MRVKQSTPRICFDQREEASVRVDIDTESGSEVTYEGSGADPARRRGRRNASVGWAEKKCGTFSTHQAVDSTTIGLCRLLNSPPMKHPAEQPAEIERREWGRLSKESEDGSSTFDGRLTNQQNPSPDFRPDRSVRPQAKDKPG